MKVSAFKALKLKHGEPVVIIWDDIVEHGNYGYKPDKPVNGQLAQFIFMGWFLAMDKDKISIAIEPEITASKEIVGEHPFRTVQVMSIGDIKKMARLPKPRKWFE